MNTLRTDPDAGERMLTIEEMNIVILQEYEEEIAARQWDHFQDLPTGFRWVKTTQE